MNELLQSIDEGIGAVHAETNDDMFDDVSSRYRSIDHISISISRYRCIDELNFAIAFGDRSSRSLSFVHMVTSLCVKSCDEAFVCFRVVSGYIFGGECMMYRCVMCGTCRIRSCGVWKCYEYLCSVPFCVACAVVCMAQWIRRLPTEQEIPGSIPGADYVVRTQTQPSCFEFEGTLDTLDTPRQQR